MKRGIKIFSVIFRGAIFAMLLLTQFSCSYMSKVSRQSPENWQQTIAQRQQLSSWKLTGRLGMQTETNGGSLDLFLENNLFRSLGEGDFDAVGKN